MSLNTALLFAARLASAGTTLLMLALVARFRGAEALGAVGVGLAVGAIAAAISDLGLSSLLVRESARRPEAAAPYLGAGLLIRAVTVPALLAIIHIVAEAIAAEHVTVVVLAAAGLVSQQAVELTRSIFLARLRMRVVGAHAVAENVVWIAVIAIGLDSGAGLVEIFAAALGVWLASLLVGLGLARALLGVSPVVPRRADIRAIGKRAAPFAAFSIVGIAYARLDPLLLGLLATGPALATAGAYFAAARLVGAFEYLPEAVSRAAFPELSRRADSGASNVEPILRPAARALLAVGLAIPAVVVPASGWIMATLFEVEAASSGWILAVLACVVPIRYLGYLYGVTLTSSDAQGRRVFAASSALVLVAAIDVIGIPIVGVIAPLAGTVVAAVVVVSLYGRSVRQRFGTLGLATGETGRLVVAGVLAAGGGLVVGSAAPPVAASAVAGGLYLVLVAILSPDSLGPLTRSARSRPTTS